MSKPLSTIDASREAYRSSQKTVSEKLARVFAAVYHSPVPLMCWQIEQFTGLPHTTVSARLYDLAGKGKKPRPATIREAGEGLTPSGHRAVKWAPVNPPAPVQMTLEEAISTVEHKS